MLGKTEVEVVEAGYELNVKGVIFETTRDIEIFNEVDRYYLVEHPDIFYAAMGPGEARRGLIEVLFLAFKGDNPIIRAPDEFVKDLFVVKILPFHESILMKMEWLAKQMDASAAAEKQMMEYGNLFCSSILPENKVWEIIDFIHKLAKRFTSEKRYDIPSAHYSLVKLAGDIERKEGLVVYKYNLAAKRCFVRMKNGEPCNMDYFYERHIAGIQRDFPDLSDREIKYEITYGQYSHKGDKPIYGLEFTPPKKAEIPGHYAVAND
jgi:hypothetical protein